jgi:pyruvate dehydrogenase E1 component alpha subunit
MVGDIELYRRAEAYGFAGFQIDGNDSIAVMDAVSTARERAVRGLGPTLIEALTERLVGHYIGDVQQYRPAGEIDDAKLREPLVASAKKLLDSGFSESELGQIESEEREEVSNAADAALHAPLADPRSALEHLYAT